MIKLTEILNEMGRKRGKSNWTTHTKPVVISNIKKAGITDKGAIKTIMNFEKFLLSTTNFMYADNTPSWDAVCNSNCYNSASMLLRKLNGNINSLSDAKKAPYWEDWKKYSEILGYNPVGDIQDWIA